jgi:SLOG cluster2
VVGPGGLKLTGTEPLRRKTVAISISESEDMPGLGLAEEHLRDAMAEIARHLLAVGARLVYGGDLRAYGFSELLFELVSRHRSDGDGPGVISYLAWPIHGSKSAAELLALAGKLDGIAALHCLDLEGKEIPLEALKPSPIKVKSDKDWAQGLTSMRRVLTIVSDACVVLGGRVTRFKGRMPGVAEEALCTLRAGHPLYVLGGFGGCARDIAEDLGLLSTRTSSGTSWPGRNEFQNFDLVSLQNGLGRVTIKFLLKQCMSMKQSP